MISDIRRTMASSTNASPAAAHLGAIGKGNYNRFSSLIPTRSRADSFSGKRKASGDIAPITPLKLPKMDSNKVFTQLKDHEKNIIGVKNLLAKVSGTCAHAPDDGMNVVIGSLVDAIDLLASGQETLASALVDMAKAWEKPAPVYRGPATPGTPYLPTKGTPFVFSGAAGTFAAAAKAPPRAAKPAKPLLTAEETLKKKVILTLRDAERKTVVFETDLGPTPILNKDTIATKFSMALCNKVKDGKHTYSTKDAEDNIDDILSCSKLEFLGSGTRKFFNDRDKKDPRNGKMCTIPVRMDFPNKETRVQAEISLRQICKVRCSIPYPKKLRGMVAAIVAEGKALHDKAFIRAKVDIDNLTLHAHARTESGWKDLNISKTIPLDILDRNSMMVDLTEAEEDDMVISTVFADSQIAATASAIIATASAASQIS